MDSKENVVNSNEEVYTDTGLHLLGDAVLLLEQQVLDCRAENGSRENKRVNYIVDTFNNILNGDLGKLEQLFINTDLDITHVHMFSKAGGCGNHYDLIIHMADGITRTIEHKGIKSKKSIPIPINDFEQPWSLTPQLLNETHRFSNTHIYLKLWYYKAMPEIKSKWVDLPDIPNYEDWVKLDASMGSAKSDWGIALKEKRKASKTNLTFIDNLYKKYLKQFWTTISDNQEFKDQLRDDLLTNISGVLAQKDYWINTFYKTTTDIKPTHSFVSVTPQISNLSFEIDLGTSKRVSKAILSYNLSSNPGKVFKGEARLRWGNGNGISNIRWNIS